MGGLLLRFCFLEGERGVETSFLFDCSFFWVLEGEEGRENRWKIERRWENVGAFRLFSSAICVYLSVWVRMYCNSLWILQRYFPHKFLMRIQVGVTSFQPVFSQGQFFFMGVQ